MENFWYLELGGMGDSIADTEKVRDELLKTAYGVWDYVKNAPENKEKNKDRRDWQSSWAFCPASGRAVAMRAI